MARPFLVPPKARTPQDRLRYWARAKGLPLYKVGLAIRGTRHAPARGESNKAKALAIFYRKQLWPEHIEKAAAFLELPDEERRLLHQLAARQIGYDV